MATRTLRYAMPGVVFVTAFWLSGAFRDRAPAPESPLPDPVPCEHAEPPPGDSPPSQLEIDSRLHGCQTVSYASLGRFLSSRGVNLAATGNPDPAGELYAGAGDALGVPKIDSRLGERSFHTTAGATKLFDIFLQAAPEIIANIGDPQKAPACSYVGQNKPMFEEDGSCVYESVSCLLGRPARDEDMLLCDALVKKANPADPSDVDKKRRIAVATILAAGNTCE